MNRLFLAVILSVWACLLQAEIQVQINPSPVTIDENFQLTLTQTSNSQTGAPDLSVLRKDFLILATARQVSYSVVNGQASSTSQWVLTLKALKTGVLSIPAIKWGAESSNPMTINVEAAGTQQDNSDFEQQDLLLKTSVSPNQPYVNQEISYTVKIYNSKRILDAQYEGPQAENALIIPLGDSKRYQTVQNNTSYVVEEQKYAVFPQKSGELNIIAPTYTAVVYDTSPQRVKVSDKATKLKIKAIPAKFQGNWLPAKEVHLSEDYENASQSLSQGSTLVRTITIEALGIPAQFLPALDFKATDVFSVYPEKGNDRNQIKQDELLGHTEVKVTYLFNKPGKIIIPELRLPWFNTVTGKEEVAILAPRSLEISPSLNSTSKENNEPSQEPKSGKPNSPIMNVPGVFANASAAWLLVLFFAAAWLITLYLGRKPRSPRRMSKRAEKKALAELKNACAAANPQAAKEALLRWAACYWPDASLLNLNDLTQLSREHQLKKQIQMLSQALYKKQEQDWRGEELWRAVTALKKNTSVSNSKAYVLPPINPH